MYDERRRLPDRRRATKPERAQLPVFRTALALAIAIGGGLVLVYVFFATIAEVDVAQAVAATTVIAALAVVWVVAYWLRRRNADPRGPATFDRERRGF
jgi:membrane protein implicated in regulation of membrane protease activity